MNRICTVSTAFLLLAITACNTRPPESATPSDGMPGEVMVVSEEDALDEIKEAFAEHYKINDPVLLIAEKADEKKYEKNHSFWHTRDKSFEGSEKHAPMILVFGDAGDYSSWLKKMHPVKEFPSKSGFTMQVYKNVWAKPQTVIRLRYGRDISPQEILQNGGAGFMDSVIQEFEIAQGLPGNLAANAYTDSVSSLISNTYGFRFQFPPQFRLAMSNTELVWLHQETSKFYRDIFINIFSDSTPLETREDAIKNRDYFSEKYIRNTEGTKVRTSQSALFPVTYQKNRNIGGSSVHVLRGWYQEEGTFRRGPFARYIFHDKQNRRYIAIDGFLHAPDMDRLPFYRLFDLIAGTVRLNP